MDKRGEIFGVCRVLTIFLLFFRATFEGIGEQSRRSVSGDFRLKYVFKENCFESTFESAYSLFICNWSLKEGKQIFGSVGFLFKILDPREEIIEVWKVGFGLNKYFARGYLKFNQGMWNG